MPFSPRPQAASERHCPQPGLKGSTTMRSKAIWKTKYLLMNGLSRVPFNEKLHFAAQRLLGKHSLDAEEMFGRAAELFRVLRRAGGNVQGKTVLEIGTGWFPFAALLSYLFGAREVVTVDIHPWLTLGNAVKTFEHAQRLGEGVLEKVGADRADFAERCRTASRSASAARHLDGFFAPLGIRYLPKTDLLVADIPDGSVDVVFSSNVLEHIPPEVLAEIHGKTGRLAREGGFAVHRFNPDDHYKNLSGSSVSFLEYDERGWRLLGGYGLAYHNRLRTVELTLQRFPILHSFPRRRASCAPTPPPSYRRVGRQPAGRLAPEP